MRLGSRLFSIALLLFVALPAGAKTNPEVPSGRLEFRLPDLDANPVAAADPRLDGKVLLAEAPAPGRASKEPR